MTEITTKPGKVGFWNKLAFACGDIFGGGSFNVINFLFTPFLTLVVGIPMVWLFPILLFTKLWDGFIDPFIGKITDAKQPGKFGKRRIFMLIFAPAVLVTFVLLFFPWNLVVSSTAVKILLVIICYMLYATSQSFVLIPYYSHASEMTDDFTERNRTNAVRLAFSIVSSLVCVVVPGMIAGPERPSYRYIVMAALFGTVFMLSILVAALFSREQIVTPAVKVKLSFKEFLKPLKVKTYRQYLGMQMCTSMGMAIMSSFFYTYCDFYLRNQSYQAVTMDATLSRFPVATIAAAMMFVAQIIALPIYMRLIKVKSKRFAYIFGASTWIAIAATMWLLAPEQSVSVSGTSVVAVGGSPNWLIVLYGLLLGLGIGGAVYIPHSAFGDVCDVGQLYFGERTEGAFSGITNFLNTAAQALGLALPPLLTGLAGYAETQYLSAEEFANFTGDLAAYQVSQNGETYKLLPLWQSDSAQIAIRIAFIVIPIVILALGIVIASGYKLTKEKQQRIVEINAMDHSSEEYQKAREDVLSSL